MAVFLGGPRFADNDENHKVTVNQDAELLCSLNFHPAVTFKWIFEFAISDDGSREVVCTNENESQPITDTVESDYLVYQTATLFIIMDTEFDDAGVYWCKASHMYNSHNKTFHLSIRSEFQLVLKQLLSVF